MSEPRASTVATPWVDFVVVVTICWGWPILGSLAAVGELDLANRPGDRDFISLVVYELVTGAAAVLFLRARGWSIASFSFDITWRNTGVGLLLVVAAFVLNWLAYGVGKTLGGSTIALDNLQGGGLVSVQTALIVANVNGAYEELLLVGFVFKVLDRQSYSFAIGVSSLLRMLAHVYQGPVGALSVLCYGIMVALIYARYRQLWPLIVSHIVLDFLALA